MYLRSMVLSVSFFTISFHGYIEVCRAAQPDVESASSPPASAAAGPAVSAAAPAAAATSVPNSLASQSVSSRVFSRMTQVRLDLLRAAVDELSQALLNLNVDDAKKKKLFGGLSVLEGEFFQKAEKFDDIIPKISKRKHDLREAQHLGRNDAATKSILMNDPEIKNLLKDYMEDMSFMVQIGVGGLKGLRGQILELSNSTKKKQNKKIFDDSLARFDNKLLELQRLSLAEQALPADILDLS